MNRSIFLSSAIAMSLVAAGLAGCAQVRSVMGTETYDATLSAAQEVPPNTSRGTGTADVRYDRNSSMLRWTVNYSGLTGPVTGGHIHGPAGPGQNAGVLVPFPPPLNTSPITGEARITAEQASQLASGQWYVNLHTQQHPGGEIRGQLRPHR